jgi:hypothetical protein
MQSANLINRQTEPMLSQIHETVPVPDTYVATESLAGPAEPSSATRQADAASEAIDLFIEAPQRIVAEPRFRLFLSATPDFYRLPAYCHPQSNQSSRTPAELH